MTASAPPATDRPQMDPRFRARRRQVAAGRARRRRRILGSVAAVLALGALAAGLSSSPLFAVDEVRVLGVAGERAALVERLAGIAPGEALLSVDLARVRAEVETLPWVRSAAVSRVPPSTVAIQVTPRQPVAVVALPGATWLVDADGVVVAGGATEDLVVIEAPSSVLPGVGAEVSDAAVRNALAVHLGLPGPVRALVDRYEAPSERGLRLHLAAEGIWVRFGRADRIEAKAQVIALLLEQAREQARRSGSDDLRVAELDVRAPENPVLIPAGEGSPEGEPEEGSG